MANYLDRLIKSSRRSRLTNHPAAPILLAAIVCAAIGMAIPPLSTDSSPGPGLDGDRSTTQLPPAEDSAAFRTMSRWGTDIQSAEGGQTPTVDQPHLGLNPELVKLGFIGLSLTTSENAVRLTRPDGHSLRLTEGDSLPDGRILVSVTDNALTLEDAKGERETLVLFPRHSPTATAD